MTETRVEYVGLTAAEAERIAESVVAARLVPVQRRLSHLEAEMADVERAVHAMHRDLVQSLDALRTRSEELIGVGEAQQRELSAANERLDKGNAQLETLRRENAGGFATLSGDMQGVDHDLRLATAGFVRMALARLEAEAQGPLERIRLFGGDIQERFAKAIERVHYVRGEHDQLVDKTLAEFERKVREIGKHIYRIYDEDFQAFAETPLTAPRLAPLGIPLSLDATQVEARTRTLGEASARVRSDVLQPLQAAGRDFAAAVTGAYACSFPADADEFAVPVAFLVQDRSNGTRQVEWVVDARVNATPVAGVGFALSEEGAQLSALLGGSAARVLDEWRGRPLAAEEVAHVKRHLRAFAEAGQLDTGLLPGYDAYLDSGMLQVPQAVPERFEETFEDSIV